MLDGYGLHQLTWDTCDERFGDVLVASPADDRHAFRERHARRNGICQDVRIRLPQPQGRDGSHGTSGSAGAGGNDAHHQRAEPALIFDETEAGSIEAAFRQAVDECLEACAEGGFVAEEPR